MKKLLFIMTFTLAVLVANAQISKVPAKVADLPKAITENVAKSYTGYTIKEATRVTENNVVCYNVKINKGTANETLVYDKDGKFLRKMTQTAATAAAPAKPAAKPATKPATVKK